MGRWSGRRSDRVGSEVLEDEGGRDDLTPGTPRTCSSMTRRGSRLPRARTSTIPSSSPPTSSRLHRDGGVSVFWTPRTDQRTPAAVTAGVRLLYAARSMGDASSTRGGTCNVSWVTCNGAHRPTPIVQFSPIAMMMPSKPAPSVVVIVRHSSRTAHSCERVMMTPLRVRSRTGRCRGGSRKIAALSFPGSLAGSCSWPPVTG